MANWILVMTGNDEEFKFRITAEKWPIYGHTTHRNSLKVGDNVVFYRGGAGGMIFAGSAMINSKLIEEDGSDYHVELSEIKIWKPISIRPLIKSFSFVRHKTNWGIHFQGGVVHLPSNDYKLILSKAKT